MDSVGRSDDRSGPALFITHGFLTINSSARLNVSRSPVTARHRATRRLSLLQPQPAQKLPSHSVGFGDAQRALRRTLAPFRQLERYRDLWPLGRTDHAVTSSSHTAPNVVQVGRLLDVWFSMEIQEPSLLFRRRDRACCGAEMTLAALFVRGPVAKEGSPDRRRKCLGTGLSRNRFALRAMNQHAGGCRSHVECCWSRFR
jgi:hypothetical protein